MPRHTRHKTIRTRRIEPPESAFEEAETVQELLETLTRPTTPPVTYIKSVDDTKIYLPNESHENWKDASTQEKKASLHDLEAEVSKQWGCKVTFSHARKCLEAAHE